MKSRTLAAVALMITIGAGSAANSEDRLVLSPSAKMDPAAAFVMIEEKEDGSRQRFPVTDIHLDIVHRQGKAYEALTSPDKPGREPFREMFLAHLLVVARGRLYRDGIGLCSAWEKDVAVCGIECDGGHFLLRRKLGKTTHSLTLLLRPVPELFSEGGDDSAEIRIGDCGGDGISIYLDAASNRHAEYSFSTWAVNPD
jgi:hypothetical protein